MMFFDDMLVSPQEFIEEEPEEDGEEDQEEGGEGGGRGRGGVSMKEVQRLLKAEMKRSLSALEAADRPTCQVNALPTLRPLRACYRPPNTAAFPGFPGQGLLQYPQRFLCPFQHGVGVFVPCGISRLLLPPCPGCILTAVLCPCDGICYFRIPYSPGGS